MLFRLGTRKNYVAPSKSICLGLVLLKKNDYKKNADFLCNIWTLSVGPYVWVIGHPMQTVQTEYFFFLIIVFAFTFDSHFLGSKSQVSVLLCVRVFVIYEWAQAGQLGMCRFNR